MRNLLPSKERIEEFATVITQRVGSISSLVWHTIIFLAFVPIHWLGVSWSTILLVVTTAVSLEAIYLAILIQMTVNKENIYISQLEQKIADMHKRQKRYRRKR